MFEMDTRFIVEDEIHAEVIGEYESLAEAWEELKRRAAIPWDQIPNLAPCGNSLECGRSYEIVECDVSSKPWTEVKRIAGLDVSVEGIDWGPDAPRGDEPQHP